MYSYYITISNNRNKSGSTEPVQYWDGRAGVSTRTLLPYAAAGPARAACKRFACSKGVKLPRACRSSLVVVVDGAFATVAAHPPSHIPSFTYICCCHVCTTCISGRISLVRVRPHTNAHKRIQTHTQPLYTDTMYACGMVAKPVATLSQQWHAHTHAPVVHRTSIASS